MIRKIKSWLFVKMKTKIKNIIAFTNKRQVMKVGIFLIFLNLRDKTILIVAKIAYSIIAQTNEMSEQPVLIFTSTHSIPTSRSDSDKMKERTRSDVIERFSEISKFNSPV